MKLLILGVHVFLISNLVYAASVEVRDQSNSPTTIVEFLNSYQDHPIIYWFGISVPLIIGIFVMVGRLVKFVRARRSLNISGVYSGVVTTHPSEDPMFMDVIEIKRKLSKQQKVKKLGFMMAFMVTAMLFLIQGHLDTLQLSEGETIVEGRLGESRAVLL